MPYKSTPSMVSRMRAGLWFAIVLTVAATFIISGCSSDKGTGPGGDSSAGTYLLSDVDDYAPPVTIHQGPWLDPVSVTFYNKFILQVTGGAIELDDDDTFSINFTVHANGDGKQWGASVHVTGAYVLEGDELWFYPDDENQNPVVAYLNGDTINLTLDFMGKGVANTYHFSK